MSSVSASMRGAIARPLLYGLCTIFLGFIVLAAAELWLRRMPDLLPPSWQIRLHERSREHKVVAHPETGFLLQSHQHEQIDNPEYAYLKETDAAGFPNREPWPEQAEIVFLGDSLITGEGVGIDGQFSTLVDEMLPDQRVVNLGVPGAGPERQYRIYRHFGAGLQAKWVVTCWYLSSDLMNDESFHAWIEDDLGMAYNPFRLSYRRRTDPRSRYHPARVLERSVLYAMAHDWLSGWFPGRHGFSSQMRFADGSEVLFDPVKLSFAAASLASTDAEIERAFASLQRLQTMVRGQGATTVVMFIPSKEELFGVDADLQTRNAVARVRQRLHATDVPMLDLYPALRQGGDERSPFFRRDSHLNAYGNRVVAEQFVAWLHRHGA